MGNSFANVLMSFSEEVILHMNNFSKNASNPAVQAQEQENQALQNMRSSMTSSSKAGGFSSLKQLQHSAGEVRNLCPVFFVTQKATTFFR